MEPKFQTSFIPKKQNVVVSGTINANTPHKANVHGASFLIAFSIILFAISIGGAIGAYFWKYYLTKANKEYKIELSTREKQFDIALIEKLKVINTQINSARNLVDNHLALSSIFEILQKMVISDVRFMSMDLKSNGDSGNLSMNIKAQAKNLPAVAFQSEILSDMSKLGLSKIVSNPLVSSPSFELNGGVSFDFSAEINRGSMTYKRSVLGDDLGQDVSQ